MHRLPEAYVDRAAVEQGRSSTFPFYDISTGELKAKTPTATESHRIRVTRDRLRRLLATDLDIQACDLPHSHLNSRYFCRSKGRSETTWARTVLWLTSASPRELVSPFHSGAKQSVVSRLMKMGP